MDYELHHFNVPATRIGYDLKYLSTFLGNLIDFRQMDLSKANKIFETEFLFTEELQQKWYDALDVEEKDHYIPFTYFIRASLIAWMLEMVDAHVPLAHLYHIRTRISTHKRTQFKDNHTYTLRYSAEDVLKVSNTRLCLVPKLEVYNEQGDLMLVQEDFFLERGVSKRDMEAYEDIFEHKYDPKEFRRIQSFAPGLWQDYHNVHQASFYIPAKMGKRYADISGDHNPFHTHPGLAKLFGEENVFLQGMCTLNLALYHLGEIIHKLDMVDISFCRKIYEEQNVTLFYTDDQFELVDHNHHVVAFGKYHAL